jgi:hypothetical protein
LNRRDIIKQIKLKNQNKKKKKQKLFTNFKIGSSFDSVLLVLFLNQKLLEIK